MKNKVLFIGNGINNLNNKQTWNNLIKKLKIKVGNKENDEDLINEFPLVYENLLLIGKKNKEIIDRDLKYIIASEVKNIKSNEIHKRIDKLEVLDIITTNYDLVLENGYEIENSSIIDEKKYCVFRKFKTKDKIFWYIHGDIRQLNSINLGFEHYCGQLQMLRNYLVTGTNYKSKKVHKEPLTKRLHNNNITWDSWIDLLFLREIHIIGLRLDFVEIDLWWLFTFRAKLKFHKQRKINNKIFYYIPKKYSNNSSGKLELLKNMGIIVIEINKEKYDYYHQVLNMVES